MAVDGEHHVRQLWHQPVQIGEEGGVLVRHGVADGVRDVDRGRALVDGDLDDLGGELPVRSGGVHRGELDVLAQLLGLGDGRPREPLHVLPGRLQLVLEVDVGRGDERVDARSFRVPDGLPCTIDVRRVRAGQAGDDRADDLARDRLHRLEVAGRGDREAGFDDVDVQSRELVRDLELLGRVQRDARRLLPVAQRCVEDLYVFHASSFVLARSVRSSFAASGGRHAQMHPPSGGGEEGGEGRAGTTRSAECTSAPVRCKRAWFRHTSRATIEPCRTKSLPRRRLRRVRAVSGNGAA